MARIHRVSGGVIHLATSSRLVDATKWYDLQSGAVLESWSALKRELIVLFERKVPFYVAVREVEARVWIPNRETFRQYAIDKLALMHSLKLLISDQINLLIGGITIQTVKATALALRADTVEQFLEVMRTITEGLVERDVRAPVTGRAVQPREVSCRNCGKKGHTHKVCRDVICFYCRNRGFECPKLNRGEGRAATGAAVTGFRGVTRTDDRTYCGDGPGG